MIPLHSLEPSLRVAVDMTREAFAKGKPMAFTCKDQGKTIRFFQIYFPKAFYELIDEDGIKIWNRKI